MTSSKYRMFMMSCGPAPVEDAVNAAHARALHKFYNEDELTSLLEDGWCVDKIGPISAVPGSHGRETDLVSMMILRKAGVASPCSMLEVNE